MFKQLLVPLDGSLLAECVLPHTIALARVSDARVTLLRVVPAPPQGTPIDVMDWQMLKAEAEAYLEGVAAHIETAGLSTNVVVPQGDPARSMLDYMQSTEIDLVLLSSHGESGLTGWNIGSVVQKVLLHAPVSSSLVRAYQPLQTRRTDLRYQRLLVPLDGSMRAECVLPIATQIAECNNAQLLLAHVVPRPQTPRHLPLSQEDESLVQQLVAHNRETVEDHLEWLMAHLPVPTQRHVLECEDVAAGLHELAETQQVDLMVMSAHGYSGRNQWSYGSVTSNFIVYGSTPLLIVQDLDATERQPTAAEMAAQNNGGHRYMAKERFPEPAHSYARVR